MGLWTMDLDGTHLHQIIRPQWNRETLLGIDHPSWTPDGKWIVFEERMRSLNHEHFNIAICDASGEHVHHILEATGKIQYRQPSVSPDGKTVALSMYPNGYPGGRHLWLVDVDGVNSRQLLNDKGKAIGGDYPAWNPDGSEIYIVGTGVVDGSSGKTLLQRSPRSVSSDGKTLEQYSNVIMPHWGKMGLLCSGWGGGITVVDTQFDVQRVLATSGKAERDVW